jgi:hypothetical protein
MMKKFVSGILAAALATSLAATAVISANAAPVFLPKGASASTDVQQVAWRGHNRVYVRRGHHYWRGHRGYRHYRHGYKRHGDFWFPLAAFATGAIISGAIANDRPAYGSSHEQRCYARYRSYRAYDNTYQPYNGPRRQCTL